MYFAYILNLLLILNKDSPTCINCKYYKPNLFDIVFDTNFSKCKKFGTKNVVTNKYTYEYASACRKNESYCGENGYYFESNNFDFCQKKK